jgi:hypothetical protein
LTISLTKNDASLRAASRELNTTEAFPSATAMHVTLDSGKHIDVSLIDHRHFDLGYAVTSHSSQGLTADQVFVHIDTAHSHPDRINNRLAYVAVSRAQLDLRIFTDNADRLAQSFGHEVSKTSALDLLPQPENTQGHEASKSSALELTNQPGNAIGTHTTAEQAVEQVGEAIDQPVAEQITEAIGQSLE